MKKTDMIIIGAMITIAVVTLIIYVPKFHGYIRARDAYADIQHEYVHSGSVQKENKEEIKEKNTEENTDIQKNEMKNEINNEEKEEGKEENQEENNEENNKENEEEKEEPATSEKKMETLTPLKEVSTQSRTFPNAKYLEDGDFNSIMDKVEDGLITVDHKKLLEDNKDYIGWIYVPGTDISYPVVKSADNKEYLHKLFDGSSNSSGCIFRDTNCNDMTEEHIILYGHNMRDNSMFAQLKSFVNEKDFVTEHPVFWFLTDNRIYLYKVFSSHRADPSDRVIFGSQETDYRTKQRWMDAIETMKEKSVFDSDTDVTYGDQVMTLSTCTSDRVDRAVVHGKLIAYSGQK